MTNQTDAHGKVLLLGSYASMVAATRLIAKAGFEVVVGRTRSATSLSSSWSCAEYSKYASETWDHPNAREQPDAFISALEELLASRPDISVVMPISDIEITALARQEPNLPNGVVLASPSAFTVEMCENKTELMRLATELGIPQAPYALVTSRAELVEQAEKVGYPCIVKNSDSQDRVFGKKAIICKDSAELERRFTDWPKANAGLIVQGYVRGPRFNVSVVAREGRSLAMLQSLVRYTDRADETGQNVDSISVPLSARFRDQCEKLSSALKLHGIALFQFIEDEGNNSTHLLEINPRPGQTFVHHAFCGLNLPVLAIKIARGEPLSDQDKALDYRLGVNIAHTHADLWGIKDEFENGDISIWAVLTRLLRTARSFVRADIHCTWQQSDPVPTLMMYGAPFRRRWYRLIGRQA